MDAKERITALEQARPRTGQLDGKEGLNKRMDALEVQHVLNQKQTQETNQMVEGFQRPF